MKCSNCGRILTGEENFCRICGNKIERDIPTTDESFTGNIDVTKVKIPTKSFDDELNTKIKNNTSELDAMMEIANSIQKSELDTSEPLKEDNKIFDAHLDEESNNDVIQNTQDLLLTNDSDVDNNDSFLSEPTILVPNDLINSYSKNTIDTTIVKDEINIDAQEKEDKIEDIVLEDIKTQEPNVQEEIKNSEEITITETPNNNIEITPEVTLENIVDNTEEKVKIVYKKRKNSLSILLSILFVISLVSIGYLTYLLLSSYNIIQSVNNSNIKLEDEISELKEKNNDFEFELNSKNNENNNKIFTYNKYILKVLDSFEYSIDENLLIIKNDKISLDINFDDKVRYSEIKENMDEYSKTLTDKGYTISSHGVKVEDEREYIFYLVAASDGKNSLIVYSMIDENNTIGILINSDNVNSNYDDLKITNTIIESISINNEYKENNITLFDEKNDN